MICIRHSAADGVVGVVGGGSVVVRILAAETYFFFIPYYDWKLD